MKEQERKSCFLKVSPEGEYFNTLLPGKGKIAIFLGVGPASRGYCWDASHSPFLELSVPVSVRAWVEIPCPLSACKSRRVCVAARATGNWPKWGPRGIVTVKSNLRPAPCLRIKSTCKICLEDLMSAGFASWKHCCGEVGSLGGTFGPLIHVLGLHVHMCVL